GRRPSDHTRPPDRQPGAAVSILISGLVSKRCSSNAYQLGATLVDALGGLYPLTLRRKFLPQRVIGCGQLARPFRDELVALLVDSRLFAHGALLTAYRRHPS